MIKEIKYNGFSASPGDHEALEGDLCVAMNLIPEHNTIRPVLPPKVIAQIPGDTNLPIDKGRKIVCIHQMSAFKHFIVAIDYEGLYGTPFTYLYQWSGTEGGQLERIGDRSFTQVYKVEPVGNTLVVLADDGIHYFLWKSGAYQYLGTHLPELDLKFSLSVAEVIFSDWHTVELKKDGSTPSKSSIENDKELSHAVKQAIMASLNQAVAKAFKKKHFVFPFFVRYAYRLYDGDSITMHSCPALMLSRRGCPDVSSGFTLDENGFVNAPYEANVMAQLSGYDLLCHVQDMGQVDELDSWQDIVTDVDIYISPQFYTYDQAEVDENIDIFNAPHVNTRDIAEDVCNNGNFFLLTSISVKSLKSSPSRTVKVDFEPSNDNIVVRERMTDDYGSHDELKATKSFSYNGRVNLSGVSKKLFKGFNPACMWFDSGHDYTLPTVRDLKTTHAVVVEIDGREIIMQSDTADVFYINNDGVIWYFYPNQNAKRVYVKMENDIVMLELKAHPMLNGAYFCSLEEDAVQQSVDSIPTPSTDDERMVDMPNKVYTSEVDNPFYFPKLGINSIGTGNVLGICAAVRPVSTGQMGYADLYIFADSGIWTAKINKEGTYSDVTLATGDICINPDSITQMETSVLFTTDRGIMLISGSQAQCISEAIDDDGQPFTLQHPAVDDMATMLGLDVGISPFKDFVRECRMVYDYTGQRIIVYNPGYNYAYIYSLESNKWGMMESDIEYSVRAYPAALAVTRDGELVNCSVGDSSAAVTQMLITRPLSLDLPDVQKTVRAVLQRGLFIKRQGHVRSILFASRDMLDWFSMMSSKDEDMRGFSGTGFKWFRVGLLLQLEPHESIQGCSIQYDTKYTNRLR